MYLFINIENLCWRNICVIINGCQDIVEIDGANIEINRDAQFLKPL